MQPLIQRSPPAAVIYYGTFGMWVVADLRVNIRNRGGRGENLDRGSRFWVVLCALASHLGPEWTAFARTRKRLIPMVW